MSAHPQASSGQEARERLDLEAIRKRCEAATEGPWLRETGDERRSSNVIRILHEIDGTRLYRRYEKVAEIWEDEDEGEQPADPSENSEADAEFIAHAREDVPALLAEVDRLRALLRSAPASVAATEEPRWQPRITAPTDGETVAEFGPYVAVRDGGKYWLEAVYGGEWLPLYDRVAASGAESLEQQPVAWRSIDEADTTENRPWSVLVVVHDDDGVSQPVVGEARYYENDGWFWAGVHPNDYHAHQIHPSLWTPMPVYRAPAAPRPQERPR